MAEELGGLDPAMTGDDLMIVADQNRVGKPKPLDAVGDLADLLARMGTRIASIGSQIRNGYSFDRHGLHGFFLLDCEMSAQSRSFAKGRCAQWGVHIFLAKMSG